MVKYLDQFASTKSHTVVRTVFATAMVVVVCLANAGVAQTARQVTLSAVADSGLYGDAAGSSRSNRGAGGRFDIGPAQCALLKFNLSGLLGAQEVIQTATLQIKEAQVNGYKFDLQVAAYPMAAPWQEGVGTSGYAGSTGYPWGPVSMHDAVYLYSDVTQLGIGGSLGLTDSWISVLLAADGVPWNTPGAKGIGTDVLDRKMIDQVWRRPQSTPSIGAPMPTLTLTVEGVSVLNDWAKGTVANNGMNVWASALDGNQNSARCAARELYYPPQLVLTIVSVTSITDLATSNAQWDRVTLNWTSPSATPGTGYLPASYDIRYSTSAITEANWSSATPVAGAPTPAAPGSAETFVVTGLSELTTYYFAIKSTDTGGAVSALSNVPSVTTLLHDVYSPSAVTDLAAGKVLPTQVDLCWTATGDDNMTGGATRYEIRYSTAALNDANFGSATLVSQSLVPRLPMYWEKLTVTGLTANTTYYFALKAYDDVNNASALSNIATVTTSAVDTTAPASIADLVASGTNAASADLAWTAPSDNGSTASYDIRYSTATINDGNWASATRAPCLVPPQAAGNAEHFTVIGLQPGTAYYFAVKTTDKQGNTSALSNVATRTTGSLPSLPLVTSIQIAEKDGVTTANYPVTLSMGFAKGAVADNVTVRAAGLILSTQTDVKVRWADGSVRHAMISFVIPQLQAGQIQSIEFLAGGTNYNTGWLTKDQLLSSDFDALLILISNNTRTDVSARQLLQGIASPEYWLKGGICTEFVIRDWSQRAFGQLNVSYRVRVYPGANAIRVSTVADNTWVDARGSIAYSCALALGKNSPVTVYTKTNLTHWCDARWHKVFWQGSTPSRIETRYSLPYWIKAGFVPNYDTSLVVPSATIASEYNTWTVSAFHDIMDAGHLTKYFPTTGGRWEIGPYTQKASLYLCSMDYRLAEIVIGYGDLSGSIPVHLRESDPARSFYRHPISVDDRPSIWTTWLESNQNIAAADKVPAPVGDVSVAGNGDWVVDLAHQPSLAYIPYLITGDLYYLEEMHFWACFDIGGSNGGYRGFAQGWLIDQIRGNAWAFRNIVDAAAMTPDTMPEKAYLDAKIANNINRWKSTFIGSEGPSIRSYGAGSYTGDTSIDPATCSYASGIWQDDYLTWSFIHAFQMDYPTLDMVHWGGKGVIDRFTDWPGWNRFRGAPYAMPVMGKDAGGNSVPYQTWADVNNGFADKVGVSTFGSDASNPNSYPYASRGVVALVSNVANGAAVFSWMNSQMPVSNCASDPRWAFAPQYKQGDANFDNYVNVGDLQFLVAVWGTQYGTGAFSPAADFNADKYVNVGDLQLLVSHWGE